ncbi:hypothetical protein EST38_g3824 [Candolleomyces aberdarensis]|uniref:Aminotransferase class I/classII large domain-containing protein n=1 Tax=Candolleomyces aberdarensis TaxID=2316362 RepID=A0A4Q2DP00_9AGAR|nr:hypothetical protein EST38_g3824 [Candolleomyces aberdarensis]
MLKTCSPDSLHPSYHLSNAHLQRKLMATSFALESSLLSKLDNRKRRNQPRWDADIIHSDKAGDFFSGDYLSLSHHPHLRQKFLNALASEPLLLGSTGSRALTGSTANHIGLEKYFAEELGAERTMVYVSGYTANVTFFGCVPQAGDAILFDEYIHASVHDGIRLNRARLGGALAFQHNSLVDLEAKVKDIINRCPKIQEGKATLFVVVESVYSMDGDFGPLDGILEIVERLVPRESAHVVVDEAHSIGLYGPEGKGLVRAWGLEKRVHTVVMTFTKTLNFIGGVITTNAIIYEYLSNHSVPWMFTSAAAHVDIIGMKFCFDVLKSAEADRLRETVMNLSHFFMSHFTLSTRDIPKSGLSLLNSETKNLNSRGLISPIFAIFSPDVVALQNHLNEKGYAARALAPPAVPRGEERLRVVIHAGNSEEQIKSLVEALREWALAQNSNVIKQDGALRSKL